MTNQQEWNSAAMEHHKPTKQPAVEKWMEDSANECAEMVAEWKVPRAIANGFYGVILRHYAARKKPDNPASTQEWRVGRKVPINVYDGDRPVCQCQTAEDARFIVAAVNAAIADEKMFKRAENEELVDIPPDKETNQQQVNVDHLCKDCGQPKNNSRYHLDAPGTNWGAALHWFVPRTPVPSQPCKRCSGTGVVRPAADNCPRCDGTGIETAPPSQPSGAREWPSIEFEKEAHRLAREDERGKLLSQCQREIVHEQGFDETDGPTCKCGEVAHPMILIYAATRAMAIYARQQTSAKDAEIVWLRKERHRHIEALEAAERERDSLRGELEREGVQRAAGVATERQDCAKALLALSKAEFCTPVEGYGTNSSWAIHDLCRAVTKLSALKAGKDGHGS